MRITIKYIDFGRIVLYYTNMNSDTNPKGTKTVVFRLDHEEFKRVDDIAKRFHINRSSVLRISIAKLIEDVAAGYLRLPGNQHLAEESNQDSKEGSLLNS